jgi:hypothetical protein
MIRFAGDIQCLHGEAPIGLYSNMALIYREIHMKFSRTLLAVAAGLAFSASAQAQNQYIFGFSSFDAGNGLVVNGSNRIVMSDQGWYSQNGSHQPSNQNYIVGQCTTCGSDSGEFRNWFVFDIANVASPVTSLSLRLYSSDVTLSSGNYYLNDVTTPLASLVGGTGGVAAWTDLGSGSNYGFQFFQSATDSNQFFDIGLNSAAIAGLNAAIGAGASQWAIGGAFAAGSVPVPPAPIPLPPSAALLLGGLVAMRFAMKRKAA